MLHGTQELKIQVDGGMFLLLLRFIQKGSLSHQVLQSEGSYFVKFLGMDEEN